MVGLMVESPDTQVLFTGIDLSHEDTESRRCWPQVALSALSVPRVRQCEQSGRLNFFEPFNRCGSCENRVWVGSDDQASQY